jgi:hypothetical protein
VSPDRYSLDHFIKKLPEFLAGNVIRIEKLRFSGKTETNWDSPARKVMKQKFDAWLKQKLSLNTVDVEETLFVEGLFGDLPEGTHGKFFGSICCPDLALKSDDGYTIAIELDRGSSGARLRNALTKASFNVIAGGFDRSVVLFFVEIKDRKQREAKFDPNHPILKLFEEKFSTSVLFVTNYDPSP